MPGQWQLMGETYNALFAVLSGNPMHDPVYCSLRGGVMGPKDTSGGYEYGHLSRVLTRGEIKQTHL